MNTIDDDELPTPRLERWQPLRGALVDIFKYEDQEFHYEQGRLILRGNNGTGKSRVLALQFPFLLDGEVAPHRLEPDGDPAKRIEWNLLMGRYPERTGYTWAELGRRDADGTAHYITIGCGLRAVDGRGIVDRWFFVTPQRIGRDLSLLTPERVVLGRERLAEALLDERRLFRDAKRYRAEVNRVLFGLEERRYAALVDLLIQLRKPQLSRSLDERGLSAALSEALPPTSSDVIGPVAEAFRGLEDDRVALERYTDAERSVRAFMKEYRRYSGIAARRAAATVRQGSYQYDARRGELRAAEERHSNAVAAIQVAREKVDLLEEERVVARAELSTLEASPEKRKADELDQARVRAEERAREAERAAERHARAADEHRRMERARDDAVRAEGGTRVDVEKHLAAAVRGADAAGLGALHRTLIDPLGLPGAPDAIQGLDAAQRRLAKQAESRRVGLRGLKKLNDKVRDARARLEDAEEQLLAEQSSRDEALEREVVATAAQTRAAEDLIAAFRAWSAGLRDITIDSVDAVRDALDAWCESPDGRCPTEAAAALAADEAKRRAFEERARLRSRADEIAAKLTDLRAQHADLAAGRHVPPPPPPARDVTSRAAREGGPLWMLCDFQPDVDDAARAGIEAALEAAGLLDAWVTPDGRLLSERANDTLLVAGASPLPEGGHHLGQWLAPGFDASDPRLSTMREATIEAVLRHIGAGSGAGHIWIAADGRFQIGPLHGAWTKPAAEHIGHSAREVSRRRRLEEIAAEIARVEIARAEIEQAMEALEERARRIDRERAASPDGEDVVRAHRRAQGARAEVLRCEERLAGREKQRQARRAEAEAAATERDAVARDLGIADPSMDLDALIEALHAHGMAIVQLIKAVTSHAEASRALAALDERLRAAADGEARARLEATEARDLAGEAAAVRDTLQATIGAAVAEVLRRLDAARRRVGDLERTLRGALKEREDAAVAEGVAQSAIKDAARALDAATERRKAAVDDFAWFLATGLGATASEALVDTGSGDWTPTRAVEIARHFEVTLEGVPADDSAWERSEKGIHRHIEELRRTLSPYDHEPSVIVDRGHCIVTALFAGKQCSMREFEAALDREVKSRAALLTAKEREVIENHLSAEVALHLHKLIREAEAWVHGVNAELDARPTSTGMRLRFAWEPLSDEVPGLLEARRRLLRTEGTWTPAERAALGEFLSQRIQLERQRRETGTWQEHLTAALDYRRWHRFVVERYQDKVWRPLTKKTHGTGSGGEKAIALTIPQFAAAAAHYGSARPTAPRLILLDEAFVGVDKRMRGHCMALLTAFDLDFVMTSESEWGCYPTVPGLAVCQLSTRPDVDAVGVTHWIWNGRERVRADAARA